MPLTSAALDVLDAVRPLRSRADLFFPPPSRPATTLSEMTLTKILQATGLVDRVTVHGFRSAFRTRASGRACRPASSDRDGTPTLQKRRIANVTAPKRPVPELIGTGSSRARFSRRIRT